MRRTLLFFILIIGLFAGTGGLTGCGAKSPPAVSPAMGGTKPELRIAAAADLAKAFADIGAKYEQKTGQKIACAFGASGMLTQQIEAGAPFDVFAAANQEYINKLAKENKVLPETSAVYAIGQVVLWTQKSAQTALKSLQDLTAARFAHIALANPEHAPYGKAAKAALQNAKLWDTLKPKIVYGENAQQALQFAQSGNADAALVSHALTFGIGGNTLPVPQELYPPLKQAIAVTQESKQKEAASAFVKFVTGPEGRAILQKYGFSLP